MLSLKQIGTGFAAGNSNPFAGLEGAAKNAPKQSQPKKKPSAASSSSSSSSTVDAEAAAEKKRQKNREKRLRAKKKAAQNGQTNGNGHSHSTETNSDDEDSNDGAEEEATESHEESSSSSTTTSTANDTPSRRLRPSPLAVTSETKAAAQFSDRVPTPIVKQSGVPSNHTKDDLDIAPTVEESEEEVEEEEETATQETDEVSEEEEGDESDDGEVEDEDDEADEDDIDAQVVSLGYTPELVAAARAQLESSGIPVDTEMLLLAVQQEDALAQERATGKHTVFKKPTKAPLKRAPPPAAPKALVAQVEKVKTPVTKPAPATQQQAVKPAKSTPPPAATVAASATPSSSTSSRPTPQPRNQPVPSGNNVTVAALEAAAKSWSPLADLTAATALIHEWAELLERSTGANLSLAQQKTFQPSSDPAAKQFSDVFHESQALEILVKTLLTELFTPEVEANKQRSMDLSLLRLFNTSLSGKPLDHKYVLESIRSIGRSLAVASPANKTVWLEKVLKLVTAYKKVSAVHEQIASAIAEEERLERALRHSTNFSTNPVASQEAEQAANEVLKSMNLDPALFFGSTDSTPTSAQLTLKKMWLSCVSSSASLTSTELLLARFSSILSKSPSHSLQLTFHLLEKEIQDKLSNTQRVLDSHMGQSGLVHTQRQQLDANKTKELGAFLALQKDHVAREKELLKRKAELMNELDKVDQSLKLLDIARGKNQNAINSIETQYSKNMESLKELNSSTLSREAELKSDLATANGIHGLIVGSYERLTQFNNATLQKLINTNASSTSTYLNNVAITLVAQGSLIEFLSNRAGFISKKLETLAHERSESLKYGLPLTQSETEQSLQATLKQDQKVLTYIKSSAATLLKKLAKPPSFGIPPAQAHQLYQAVLTLLENKKVVTTYFDLKGLRDSVTNLANLAQQAPPVAPTASAAVQPNSPIASPKQSATSPPSTSSTTTSSDPLAAALESNKPQRQSFAARKAAKEEARAAKSAATPTTTPPTTTPATNGNSKQANGKQANGKQQAKQQPKPSATNGHAAPTNGHAEPARPATTPSPPVKTWSTSLVQSPPPTLAANEDAFPSLSIDNIQKAKAMEKSISLNAAAKKSAATSSTSTASESATTPEPSATEAEKKEE